MYTPKLHSPKGFFMTRILFLGLVVFLGLQACQNDTAEANVQNLEEQLVGNWEIVEAIRNGQPTSTLNTLYMQFSKDGRLVSNLGGAREEATYELKGQTISQQGNRLSVDYTVESVNDSILVLKMTMRDTPFRFTFKRQSTEE
jgi:hypothetical protein